jgi:hypothetical protein
VSLLALIQILVELNYFFAGPITWDTMFLWENRLAAVQRRLSGIVGFQTTLAISLVLLTLSVVFPNLKLAGWFNDRRKPLSRLLLVLGTMTSFTFFSTVEIATDYKNWTMPERVRAMTALKHIDHSRRELVARAWVQDTIAHIPEQSKRQLTAFLQAASHEAASPRLRFESEEEDVLVESQGKIVWETVPTGMRKATPFPSIVELEAQKLARGASALHDIAKEPQTSTTERHAGLFDNIVDEVRSWASTADSTGYTPSFQDIETCMVEGNRLTTVLAQGESVFMDSIKAGLGMALPKDIDVVLQPFIRSLTSSLATEALSGVYPREVSDLRSAVLWLKIALAQPINSTKEPFPQWKFELRPAPAASQIPLDRVAADIVAETKAELAGIVAEQDKEFEQYEHLGMKPSDFLKHDPVESVPGIDPRVEPEEFRPLKPIP